MPRRRIRVRLPEPMIRAMDAAIAEGAPRPRSALVEAAIALWLDAEREARIDARYVAGYTRIPPDPEDEAELLAISRRAQADLGEW